MTGEFGIQNIKDVQKLSKLVTIAILKKVVADGFQASDLLAPLAEPEFKATLAEAVKDITLVPSEAKDIDLAEGMELGQTSMTDAVDILKVIGIGNSNLDNVIKILEFVKGFGAETLNKIVDLLKFLNLIK